MSIMILLWHASHRGGYYWQVPTHPIKWSGDLGTATKEAVTLAEATYHNITTITFTVA